MDRWTSLIHDSTELSTLFLPWRSVLQSLNCFVVNSMEIKETVVDTLLLSLKPQLFNSLWLLITPSTVLFGKHAYNSKDQFSISIESTSSVTSEIFTKMSMQLFRKLVCFAHHYISSKQSPEYAKRGFQFALQTPFLCRVMRNKNFRFWTQLKHAARIRAKNVRVFRSRVHKLVKYISTFWRDTDNSKPHSLSVIFAQLKWGYRIGCMHHSLSCIV